MKTQKVPCDSCKKPITWSLLYHVIVQRGRKREPYVVCPRCFRDVATLLKAVINPALKGGAFERAAWNTQPNPFPASTGPLTGAPVHRQIPAIRRGSSFQ